MTRPQITLDHFRALGGRLCLDFVNTVEDRDAPDPEEYLATYANLVEWSLKVGSLSVDTASRLIEQLTVSDAEADSALQRAVDLRETLYRVFRAITKHAQPERADLHHMRSAYIDALSQADLIKTGDHFAWEWRLEHPHLDEPLWPVIYSAIELLTTADLQRIKVCGNPDGCGWLFYDSSKNGTRRWCSMEGCGSRVKMRRQYRKRRGNSSS